MAIKIFIDGPSNTVQDVIYNVVLDSSSTVSQILDLCEGHIQSTNNMYNGNGVPSSSIGNDGNIYTDDTTKDVYIKRNGEWEKIDIPSPGPTPPPTDLPDSFLPLLGSLSEEIGGVIE